MEKENKSLMFSAEGVALYESWNDFKVIVMQAEEVYSREEQLGHRVTVAKKAAGGATGAASASGSVVEVCPYFKKHGRCNKGLDAANTHCPKGTHPANAKKGGKGGGGSGGGSGGYGGAAGTTTGVPSGWTPPAPKISGAAAEATPKAAGSEAPVVVVCVTCSKKFDVVKSVWLDRGL